MSGASAGLAGQADRLAVCDTEMVDLDPDAGSPQEPCLHWVALFLVTLSWGGIDEGGWFFDSGELVTNPGLYARLGVMPAAFLTEEEANAHCARMTLGTGSLNEGRRPKSSVHSEGEYEALVLEVPVLPRHWPETPPRYE